MIVLSPSMVFFLSFGAILQAVALALLLTRLPPPSVHGVPGPSCVASQYVGTCIVTWPITDPNQKSYSSSILWPTSWPLFRSFISLLLSPCIPFQTPSTVGSPFSIPFMSFSIGYMEPHYTVQQKPAPRQTILAISTDSPEA